MLSTYCGSEKIISVAIDSAYFGSIRFDFAKFPHNIPLNSNTA